MREFCQPHNRLVLWAVRGAILSPGAQATLPTGGGVVVSSNKANKPDGLASLAESRIFGPMVENRSKITFETKPLPDWHLVATFANGEQEHITGFKTEAEAVEWLASSQYQAWLKARAMQNDQAPQRSWRLPPSRSNWWIARRQFKHRNPTLEQGERRKGGWSWTEGVIAPHERRPKAADAKGSRQSILTLLLPRRSRLSWRSFSRSRNALDADRGQLIEQAGNRPTVFALNSELRTHRWIIQRFVSPSSVGGVHVATQWPPPLSQDAVTRQTLP